MKKVFTYLIFMLLPVLLFGQERTITGVVTSSEDGLPLPGVNVVVEGTTSGTVTDIDGKYAIPVTDENERLVFSFVGYKSQTIAIGQQTIIDVVMNEDTETLDEVVVIGYGTIKKSDLTGSVASVRGEDLVKIPAVSPMQALQGKVAGLQVTSASGSPGAGTVVRIRGQGTFNDSSPIYVVDGVILQDIDFLNPADIESIEILKDASSTAIYGARGANGVIMITTKRGKAGQQKPVISFNSEYSIQQMNRKIDLLNGREYALYVNAYDPGTYNNPDVLPNTDWQDLLFSPAPIQNHQVSVAGASEKIQYYIGLGYFKQDGIIEKSNYERFTVKLNNTFHIAKGVRVGNNITVTPFKQQNTNGNVVFTAYRALPLLTPYQPDGSYTEVPNVGNPLADIEYTNSFDSGVRGIGNFFGEVDFLKEFTFKSSFSVDGKYSKNKSFTPVFFVSAQQQNSENDLTKNFRDDFTLLWENTLNYNKEIGKHRVNVLAGYTMQDTQSEFLNIKGENIIREGDDFWYFNPSNINPTGIDDPNDVDPKFYYSMLSTLFRANYTYDNRYLLTATYRRDGSSKFAKDNQYASFPSFAVGWNIINEAFMSDYTMISNLKLRASWGRLGNEKIEYLKQFSLVDNGVNAVFSQSEVLNSGASYGVTGNPDLKWETTTQRDVGLEIGLLEDRLTAEFDYYHRVTDDILIPLEIPGFLGNGVGAQITFNAGSVLNKGFEFVVGWNDELANGIKYRASVNGTTIQNEVLRIQGGGSVSDVLYGPESLTISRVGEPIGSFFGYQVGGIFQSVEEINQFPHLDGAEPGDLRFVDINNDGQINSLDRTVLGSSIPDLLYGISLGASFKGIELSLDFQGESGASIMNYKETVRPDRYNFEQHALDYWRPGSTSTSEPRAAEGGVNWGANDYKSSRFIQSADFFRLRSATLGYSLPEKLIAKAKMQAARIYVRGTNLFTSMDFTGYSPEVASENPLENRVDRGTYPTTAIYSFGLNVTF
ncbi:MAG TPA: TonB-dependent receptor [Chryseosolibacter sp.]|nr:TonB-dependent receptor [Chryseosolibacter sp.]